MRNFRTTRKEIYSFFGNSFYIHFLYEHVWLDPRNEIRHLKSQYHGLVGYLRVFLCAVYRHKGLGNCGYLRHMAGDPRDVVTWLLVPINIPIHIIEELAKPMSLSLRLFGNITGEDVLITVFVGLGVSALSFLHLPIGIPFQLPFIFLALLTGTIQALVFTLLSTIYFSLMLPHEEH